MPNLFTVDESSFQKPKSRVAALIAYKTAADAAAKVSLFVITVVAARRLTPAAFGTFALGSTVGWMAAVGADFGMQMHLARAVARAPHQAGRLLGSWLRVRVWTAAAALAVVMLGLAGARSSADVAEPIVVLALVYAASGLVEFLHYFYRGLSRSDIESSLTMWQRAATLACGLLALAWRPTVGTLAVAMLIPVVATLAVSLAVASRLAAAGCVARPFRADEPHATVEVASDNTAARDALARVFRHDVAPIGVGIVLSALYFRVDVFLVQLWAGTESVGLYNAVFRVIEGLRLFPAAALAVALPALCRARDLRPLFRASLGVVAFASLVTALAWPVADVLIPTLFGEPYRAAVPAFQILLLAFPLLSLNYAMTQQLIARDGQHAYAGICAIALATNVALNARLIPTLSIDGAAWATLGTELVVTAGCTIALATTRNAIVDRMAGDRMIA